jgi:fatty acid synthase subunit beta
MPGRYEVMESTSTPSSSCSTPDIVFSPGFEGNSDQSTPNSKFSDEENSNPRKDSGMRITFRGFHWDFRVSSIQGISLGNHLEKFQQQLSSVHEERSDAAGGEVSSNLILASSLLDYLLHTNIPKQLLRTVFEAFEKDFISDLDIHNRVKELDTQHRNFLLRVYYATIHATKLPLRPANSALVRAAEENDAHIYIVFGGQGISNPDCLKQLYDLKSIYIGLLDDLIDVFTRTLNRLTCLPRTRGFYEIHGFDLRKWMSQLSTFPDQSYLSSSPVSFPLIGLIALSHYYIICKALGKHPGEMRTIVTGVTGHSQGILVAAAIAGADSWESLNVAAEEVAEILFWIGFESHHAASGDCTILSSLNESMSSSEQAPSHMLSVRGLDRSVLESVVRKANEHLSATDHIYLSLVNSRDSMVVAGPPKSLVGFCALLEDMAAEEGKDQSRVPFHLRKPVIQHQFLPISAPFHSPHLQNAFNKVLRRLPSKPPRHLGTALYHTKTGENLKDHSSQNLTEELVKMVMTERVDWSQACDFPEATHILDFGPGNVSSLIKEKINGSGIRVILASELCEAKGAGSKAEIFSTNLHVPMPNWGILYQPRLQMTTDGEVKLITKMTDLFGTPPVMVAGMTPTTVPWDFCSAVMDAGYHVELAGGGYSNAQDFEKAIRALAENIPIGRGITCNLIYVAPRSMAWQIPLIGSLIRQGVLIDGLTIGAGVPSKDVVDDYIAMGLKHLSFKPGTYEAILNVIAIAKAHPEFPIGLQWTGGRGGGHHSAEDFHEPIVRAYGLIRECPNIILIAGSGFGACDAKDAYPYLTGTWSSPLGYSKMPFDGILLGSRMMVAEEARTSRPAKQLIVDSQGATNSRWYDTYKEATGGVVTINSEMGQPIHVLATRGMLLWREFDETIFSIQDPIKRLAELAKRRDNVIDGLNKYFQKTWFCINNAGENVDLGDMTYIEVLRRLVSLMYVQDQDRWIHPSYKALFLDIIMRIRERLSPVSTFDKSLIDQPLDFLLHSAQFFPAAQTELLHPEDARYFLGLFGRRGQKPVNFIPALDQHFEQWFKKDSLWQAEDIDAVVDRDVQRVCIIHGPVAAAHSRKVDEPVQVILDEISRSLIRFFQRDSYPVEMEDHSRRHDAGVFIVTTRPSNLKSIEVMESSTERTYTFPGEGTLPTHDELIEELMAGIPGWIQACFRDTWITQGRTRQPNPIRSVFTARHGHVLKFKYDTNRAVRSVSLSEADPSLGRIGDLARIDSADGHRVIVTLMTHGLNTVSGNSIEFKFEYRAGKKDGTLIEDMVGRNDSIKDFYAKLWVDGLAPRADQNQTFNGGKTTLSRELLCDFMRVLGDSSLSARTSDDVLPMDIGILLAWKALVMPLLTRALDGDLLKLLHLSNRFDYFPDVTPFRLGDEVKTTSHVASIIQQSDRKLVEVVATVTRLGQHIMAVTSVFVIQGTFDAYENSFKCVDEPDISLWVTSKKTEALLRSRRDWLAIDEGVTELIGRKLVFKLNSRMDYDGTISSYRLQVNGIVHYQAADRSLVRAGKVHFDSHTCGNPVVNFLRRYGTQSNNSETLSKPQTEKISKMIRMPLSNLPYAQVSTDTNPIHTSPIFSSWLQLPGAITHGMYTSAAVRKLVEISIADSDKSRFRKYAATFQGKVLPGDEIRIEWQHVAMVEGRMQIKIQAYNNDTKVKVLDAEAEIEQAPTAYVFTGQGSQEKGMGMELYSTSEAARAVWDRGDAHLMKLYGKKSVLVYEEEQLLI